MLRRGLARLVDVAMIATAANLLAMAFGVHPITSGQGDPLPQPGTASSLYLTLILTCASFVYFVLLERFGGKTTGKMMLRLQVVGPEEGTDPTLFMIVKRNLWVLFPLVPWIGPMAQFVFVVLIAATIKDREDGRGWHDVFAGGTRVIRTS